MTQGGIRLKCVIKEGVLRYCCFCIAKTSHKPLPYSKLKMFCLHWVTSPMSQRANAVKSMSAALIYYRTKSNYCKLILWHQHCVIVKYHSEAFVQTNCTHLWNSVLYHFINLLVNGEKVQNYGRFQSNHRISDAKKQPLLYSKMFLFPVPSSIFLNTFCWYILECNKRGNACFLPFPFFSPPVEGAVVLFILSSDFVCLFIYFFYVHRQKRVNRRGSNDAMLLCYITEI